MIGYGVLSGDGIVRVGKGIGIRYGRDTEMYILVRSRDHLILATMLALKIMI
ncbi:MAG: hypothetical protein ACI9KN_000752 [Gammaproteobacteria bacterium]|jgi:hypothetical protein